MKKERLTLGDIASRLNISKTTVSFILNGKAKEKGISEKLEKRVREVVKELGYIPNQLAQSLRTGKTKTLGLIVEDISNPFFSNIAKHMEKTAYDHGYKIIFCSTENSPVRTREFLRMFHHLNVDGYIITPPEGMEVEEDIKSIVDTGEPVILLDRYLQTVSTDNVMVNNEESTFKGTRHLLDQGFSKIAFVTIRSNQPQMLLRRSGYEKAMEEAGHTPRIFPLEFSNDYTRFSASIQEMLSDNKEIDAILFAANYLGVAGIHAIYNLGLKIPEDVGVVSFDDNDLFRVSKPSITVIRQPLEEISKATINTLLHRINEKNANDPVREIRIPTVLEVRDSSMMKSLSKS